MERGGLLDERLFDDALINAEDNKRAGASMMKGDNFFS